MHRTPPSRTRLTAALAVLAGLPLAACQATTAPADTDTQGQADGAAGAPPSVPSGPGSSGADVPAPTPGSPAPSPGQAAPEGGETEDAEPSPPSEPAESGPSPYANCPPSWTVTPQCGGSVGAAVPDFGPNVLIFDPSMSMSTIQSTLAGVYTQQDAAQFGPGRYAYFFKPGQYALDVEVGFYTQVVGLGQSPDDVVVTGAVRAKADWLGGNNATCNFWRGVDNLSVVPTASIDSNREVWAVSQGTHLRRVHVHGDVALDDGGWASGGFVADSLIDGSFHSGSQQQFLTRNDDGAWQGANWNMVFVGDGNPPSASWPNPPYTVEPTTPLVREAPFLYLDAAGNYLVMVPALKTGTKGRSWADGAPPGPALSINTFYLAKPGTDTAATMNAALAQGMHLLLTPGIYHLEASLQVTRPGTVVFGLGFPTLIPDNGTAVVQVADVDGVTLAGLLLEAGTMSSPTLLELGPSGSAAGHSAAPTAMFDVHCRIGGADVGTAAICATVNSNDVLIDNSWFWRADHGAGAAWTVNRANSGLVVNGNGVTAYGLFVEHFQEYQTLWNGNGGAVYFYQSEMPYDPPDQASWTAGPGLDGYPSYKVADTVTTHQAEGLGVYSVFDNDVTADNAFETPSAPGISMHHLVTVSLRSGSITNIMNGTGGAVGNGNEMAFSSQ